MLCAAAGHERKRDAGTRYVRLVALALGLALLGVVIAHGGAAARDAFVAAGPGLIGLVGLGALSQILETAAWLRLLGPRARDAGFLAAVEIRLAGEAISWLHGLAFVAGDLYKASRLRARLPLSEVLASTYLDRVVRATSLSLVAAAGLFTALVQGEPGLRGGWRPALVGSAALAFGIASAALLGWSSRALRRGVDGAIRWLGPLGGAAVGADPGGASRLAEGAGRRAHVVALLLHVLSRLIVAPAAIVVAARFAGASVGPAAALFLIGVASAVNLLTWFVPANLGTFEAAMAFGFALMGIEAERGLATALMLRTVQLFWMALGGALLALRGGVSVVGLPPTRS